jgi:hypothetical protein
MTRPVIQLWSTLHDGYLTRVDELGDGEVTVTFDTPHVRQHARLPKGARFVARLRGEVSLVAATWEPPPRPSNVKNLADREAVEAWHLAMEIRYEAAKRMPMKSRDWDDFVARVRTRDTELEVLQAELGPRRHRRRGLALWIAGQLTPKRDVEFVLTLGAREISFERENGRPMTTERLVALGDRYWAKWARRK